MTALQKQLFMRHMIHHPYVHLSIDVQTEFFTKLSKERQVTFPREEKEFATAMKELCIPTIWVAHGDLEEYCLHKPARKKRDKIFRKEEIIRLGLLKVSPPNSDALYIKGDNSAFSDYEEKDLLNCIRGLSAKKLIITGMNTLGCVGDTIQEARLKNFEILAVYDQMACTDRLTVDADPSWHKKVLTVCERLEDDELFSKKDLIAHLEYELSPPSRHVFQQRTRALAQLGY